MSFTQEQLKELLKPIDPSRVGKDGKGFSHVEAWDIRRTMNQIFGFGNWSADVDQMELIYEDSKEVTGKSRWSVAYRACCTLRVGTATYTEWASGDATNYPSRADAHDQAMKTAESQAFKRCAVNLGDQFGLSLYKNGSTAASVGEVIGQEHGDSVRVGPWLLLMADAGTPEALMSVASEIRGADISSEDRDRLTVEYRTNLVRVNAA